MGGPPSYPSSLTDRREQRYSKSVRTYKYSPPHTYTSEAPGTSFDWFLSPEYLLPIMKDVCGELGTSARILMLGCGNSGLSEVVSFCVPHRTIEQCTSVKPTRSSHKFISAIRRRVRAHCQRRCRYFHLTAAFPLTKYSTLPL